MSEQKPSHEVKGIVRRALRQDCGDTSGEGYKKNYAALKVPKNRVASILKWRSLEPPRLFLELSAWSN
jgi:hypothetical protein